MPRDFAGRVVVVTGAAGGLGRAIARRFGAAGARVGLIDRDAAGLAETAGLLGAAGAACAHAACDVALQPEVERAVAQLRAALGGVDALVANAGITHRSAFERTDAAVIRRVMEVNFFGALHCTHAVLADVVQRRGALVAISSVAGFAPLVARTGYAASKHALHGFYGSLRSELAPHGVDVLLVCPSFVATGIEHHALAGDGRPVRHRQSIVGRRASAEEVAAQVFDAAVRGRRLLLPGTTAKLAYWAWRFAPRFYEWRMRHRLGAEMRGE